MALVRRLPSFPFPLNYSNTVYMDDAFYTVTTVTGPLGASFTLHHTVWTGEEFRTSARPLTGLPPTHYIDSIGKLRGKMILCLDNLEALCFYSLDVGSLECAKLEFDFQLPASDGVGSEIVSYSDKALFLHLGRTRKYYVLRPDDRAIDEIEPLGHLLYGPCIIGTPKGEMWMFGGDKDSLKTDLVYRLDEERNAWVPETPIPSATGSGLTAVALLQSFFLIFAGKGTQNVCAFWLFHVPTRSWSRVQTRGKSIPKRNFSILMTGLNGVLVIGGNTSIPCNEVYGIVHGELARGILSKPVQEAYLREMRSLGLQMPTDLSIPSQETYGALGRALWC